MNPFVAAEDALAEQPTLAALSAVGWTHVHGSTLAPDAPAAERRLWSDVVLLPRLRRAVARINSRLTPEAVQRACELAVTTTSPSVIEDHRSLHDLLLSGVPVAYRDTEGVERNDHARLVDFENLGNNEFLAVNQMTIIVGSKNRRPDVLLYVNGLPLGQIELKAPGGKDMATPAVNQVRHYRDTIPQLYRYVEIIGVSDLLRARVGTISTPAEHFAEWKTMATDSAERTRPQLELMIEGVFAPTRFLDLVRDFVFFETDGARTWKVLAKYHQVDAVHAAVESVAQAMGGSKRGGIVWHTQGAGKSYTMVFFANKLRRDARFANPTIVAVTDRTDLDNQLAETFTATSLAVACRQADEIVGGSNSLHELLKVPAGGIVFTTIQKFAAPRASSEMPVLSDRRNVIVMADEAHRSQYARFAENLTVALPNAVRIGFTGTPVEKADRSTRLVFGDYISVYRMRQAQEDHATVPIYYESRQIPVEVEDPDELRHVEEVLEGEDEAAAKKLVTSWAKLEKVVGAPDRLSRLADDVAGHYRERIEALFGKAIVVAYSRRIAGELTGLLRERLGEEAVDCVISAQATDAEELSRFRRSKPELKQIAKDFKDPDHPLRMVVVKDMWLTGFDVPVLHTLYVDKPMKDHGLLQAIARVNRVFRNKPGGLIVDYIGIGEDLRASLRAYDDADVDEPVIPAARAVAGLWEKYEVLCAMLHPIGFSAGELKRTLNPEKLFFDAYNLLLETEQKSQDFLDTHAALTRWYALARTQQAAIELRDDVGFFNKLASEIRQIITTADAQASTVAEQAVRQFFSEGLAAGSVIDVFGIADKDRPEISVLSDEFLDSISRRTEHPNIQVRLLEKLLNDEIHGRKRANQMQAKLFSEQVTAVLQRYELKQLTSAEVVERLVEIAKQLRDARHRHEQLGLSQEEAAFYDALAGGAEDIQADPKLSAIAHELVEGIRRDLTVDWADREATEAKVRAKIKRLLRRHGYNAPKRDARGGGDHHGLDHTAQLVLDQAKALYRYWPEVEVGDRLFV
jgi:type I restriction enzyme R subunit